MKHIKGLDTLRAFAVLFVIIQHWTPVYDKTQPAKAVIKYILIPDGSFGVFLFFVLSGFLITNILLNARSNENGKSFSIIKNFFIRRSLRIFPIYYLLLLLLLLINYPDLKENAGYFFTYTSNILCYRTNAWNHLSQTWTLAVEEQFYLLWPWLILFIGSKYLKKLFICCIIIGVTSTYYAMVVHQHMQPFLVFNCLDSLGIGGLFAYVKHSNTHIKKFEKAILIISLILLPVYYYWKIAAYTNHPEYGIFMAKTVDSILALSLIILVTNNKHTFIKKYLLENRVLNYFGTISYGIYIYQLPLVVLFNQYYIQILTRIGLITSQINWLDKYHFFYLIKFILLLIICHCSFTFIEKPFLRLKRIFKYSGEATF